MYLYQNKMGLLLCAVFVEQHCCRILVWPGILLMTHLFTICSLHSFEICTESTICIYKTSLSSSCKKKQTTCFHSIFHYLHQKCALKCTPLSQNAHARFTVQSTSALLKCRCTHFLKCSCTLRVHMYS